MPESPQTADRKSDHIRINLEEDVQSGLTTGLEKYRFVHEALPEIDLDQVDLSTSLFGKQVRAPILISSMTGGTERAGALNRTLAEAAQYCGVAMGVGSQRAALENPELRSYLSSAPLRPRHPAAGQPGRRAAQLWLHRRRLQAGGGDDRGGRPDPASQLLAGGDPAGRGHAFRRVWPEKIAEICRALPVPVIAKEVGWGISERTRTPAGGSWCGGIDVAGAGGTSWTQVEMHRLENPGRRRIAAAFQNWGIPTSETIQMVRCAAPSLPVLASGGLRDGVDIAKCIALGATLGGWRGRSSKPRHQSVDEVIHTIDEISEEIRICMFGAGVSTLKELQNVKLLKINE